MVGEDLLGVVFGYGGGEPGGELLVPDEVVATDFDFVLMCELDEGVGVSEVVAGWGWAEGAELQGVLRDDEAVLLDEDAGEVFFAEVGGADGASGEEAALVGVGFEGVVAGDGGGGLLGGEGEGAGGPGRIGSGRFGG